MFSSLTEACPLTSCFRRGQLRNLPRTHAALSAHRHVQDASSRDVSLRLHALALNKLETLHVGVPASITHVPFAQNSALPSHRREMAVSPLCFAHLRSGSRSGRHNS